MSTANDIRLVIGIPTAGLVRVQFAYSLCGLVSRLGVCGLQTRPECPIEVSIDIAASSVIHGNRETLVHRAINEYKTHILFLDDDMEFSPLVADRLFAHRQPVVATNYLIKDDSKDKFVAVALDGKGRVPTLESSTGLVPVAYSGFGVSLFDLEVFKKTPQPWFHPIWLGEGKGYTTEDNPCFERIRNAGYTCYIDQDASKLVSHLGCSAWNYKDYQKSSPLKVVSSKEMVLEETNLKELKHG
jgi:hypothetical protein